MTPDFSRNDRASPLNAAVYLPDAFVDYMRTVIPPTYDFAEFLQSCQTPLRKSIRFNTLKSCEISRDSLSKQYGWQLSPVPWCEDGAWLAQDEQQAPLGNQFEHLAGLFYIQEASSMLPPMALQFAAGGSLADKTVLDMAAAPGSKTTQLAALMDNSGLLMANEYAASRVKVLFTNLRRCGVYNTLITHHDAIVFGEHMPAMFDAVLLDAPCSGEGTIRKDPDALKNWDLASVERIAQTQRNLIISAFDALKPGGVLVYSTCTLNPIENQAVCQHLLEQAQGHAEVVSLAQLFEGAAALVTAQGYLHVWPQLLDSEGFFVAAFRKSANAPAHPRQPLHKHKYPFTPASRKTEALFDQQLQSQLGITLPDSIRLYQRDNELWLLPTGAAELAGYVKINRTGVKAADLHRNDLRFSHELAVTFGLHSQTAIALDQAQAVSYYQGRDIKEIAINGSGERIVCYRGQPLGLVKCTQRGLKNKLPRELVRDSGLTF